MTNPATNTSSAGNVKYSPAMQDSRNGSNQPIHHEVFMQDSVPARRTGVPVGDSASAGTRRVVKQTPKSVALRWQRLEVLIAATPADDHGAQWSVVSMCGQCAGPLKLDGHDESGWPLSATDFLCSYCAPQEVTA